MPIYDYECSKCKDSVEIYRKVSERDDPAVCHCGGTLKPIMSLTMFRLEGTDWGGSGGGCLKFGDREEAAFRRDERKKSGEKPHSVRL